MYFDAVLDESRNVLFNGTPKDTARWLRAELEEQDCSSWIVYPGSTLRPKSVNDYLLKV